MSNVKIGYDVELLYVGSDPERDGGYIVPPAWCEGTKREPIRIPTCPGYWQRDGVALELNGVPTINAKSFTRGCVQQLNAAQTATQEGTYLSYFSEGLLDEYTFQSRYGQEIGCEPDYNAWSEKINPPPTPDRLLYNRFAGGHLHFSWQGSDRATDREKFKVVRTLDLVLGPIFVGLDANCKRRRVYYGQAGSCRLKPYGVEWRVPDNSWFTSITGRFVHSMFDRVNRVIPRMFDYADQLRRKQPRVINECILAINVGDKGALANIDAFVQADLDACN